MGKFTEIFDSLSSKILDGIVFLAEACEPDFIKRKQEHNKKVIDYENLSIERENYQYADFLLECRKIEIHDDVARALWHLSRNIMNDYDYPNYKPFLQDDLCEQFQLDYDDINFGILEPAFIGFGCCLKETLLEVPIASEYPTYSIIGLLKQLETYYKG